MKTNKVKAKKAPVKKGAKSVSREMSVLSILKMVGQQIMLKRMERGWNLQQLASEANVSYVIISKIERGLAENVNISTLADISRALCLDLQINAVEPQ